MCSELILRYTFTYTWNRGVYLDQSGVIYVAQIEFGYSSDAETDTDVFVAQLDLGINVVGLSR